MNDHIPSLLQQHEQYLRQLLRSLDMAAPELKKAVSYSLLAGGKRFRPLLIYLSGEIFDLSLPVRDILAASVEMMHSYSLIHDDLPAMDNDDFRRGKPTCHRVFDEATAILAGDALASWSIELLLERLPRYLGSEKVVAIARCLLQASGPLGMVSGQSLDLTVLNCAEVTEHSLRHIHSLKTGCLISACIDMVLLAAHQYDGKDVEHIQAYAKELGLVFQMQDDYLDRFASPLHLGKSRSSDAANVKYTYADHFGKEKLYCEIEKRFIKAIDNLQYYGGKAEPLIQLTRQLAARSQQTEQVEVYA